MKINPLLAFIWLLLVLFLSLLLYEQIPLLILLGASIIPVAFIGTKVWASYMKYSFFSAIFIFLFNLLFLGLDKLDFTIAMVIKFLAITSAFAIFSTVADFEDMIDIAERLKLPRKAVASAAISLRFFPQVLRDAKEINESMLARGIRLEGEKLSDKIRARVPALSSLVLISLERSILAAEALELKGFPSEKRRQWKRTKMGAREMIIAAVLLFDFAFILFAILRPFANSSLIASLIPAILVLGVRR